jgi:AAA+ ATPase superfamily predicted ATPase
MQYSIMLHCIMIFLNRADELSRLDQLDERGTGGLAVVYGRRRIGKTRLLLEWSSKHDGLYTVADLSSADIQRRYFAEAVAQRLPGFADVDYGDWRSLLSRLARDAASARWTGPVIFDELPYLVLASPELPSILQRFVDHEARAAHLVIVLAGSSQRMMQGLVLDRSAPLFGRASVLLEIGPLDPRLLPDALGCGLGGGLVEAYAAWGGVPRYWELAAEETGPARARIERLILDPLGPLHREPDRLLLEEVPSALEVRPVLDAIGSGANRVSEIGARVGRPATSMARPLNRLIEMGLVRREIPFGETERQSRRSLYKVDDPFTRLWFRVVAPHRGALASGSRTSRTGLLDRYWPDLVAEAFEELCRKKIPRLRRDRSGPFGPASRWWAGDEPEWDVVAESMDRRHLLLGEARFHFKPFSRAKLSSEIRELREKPPPDLGRKYARHEIVRALFVPEAPAVEPRELGEDCWLVSVRDLLE